MLGNVLSIAFLVLLFCYIGWRKYIKHKNPEKQWEGLYPNERVKSVEELRQNENKYRKPGGGGGNGSM
ncbi:MAG TPA: hypothetical protein VFK33_11265 [Bacillales bacterium]|nr:hypothetical protein [Bacillales bacterium]